MRGLLVHFRVIVATLLVLSGCVLAVSPDETSEHCNFTGSGVCAACIRSKCQAPIDACCRDKTCVEQGTMMEAVDVCGGGNTYDCASAMKSQQQGTSAALRDCLASQCSNECAKLSPDAAVPEAKWSCEGPRDRQTDCAACIYDACGSQIDACCKDGYCKDTYDSQIRKDMAACTTGDAAGCAYMAKQSDVGVDGALRGCIVYKCAARCIGNARPHQSCTPEGGGRYCTCSDAQTSRGDCSKSIATGAECTLARRGCSCGVYGCSTTTLGCRCSFTMDGDSTSCRGTTGTSGKKCCIVLDDSSLSCKCELSQCYASSGEYDIASCDVETVRKVLADAKRLVDTCSN